MDIGTKVRITKAIDNFPTCLIEPGETGTLARIDSENAHWVKLDKDHPELELWGNQVQIWDWTGQDGAEGNPVSYYERIDA